MTEILVNFGQELRVKRIDLSSFIHRGLKEFELLYDRALNLSLRAFLPLVSSMRFYLISAKTELNQVEKQKAKK